MIIIDGYNLLYTAGILGQGRGPNSLELSRLALLNFLAESLTPGEIAKTTVVFDAKEAPWGAKSIINHRGITVQFASRWPDADCLIEELIAQNSSPKRLTVVSSDHRLQRAARRRKAKPVNSDVWYNLLVQKRLARRESQPAAPERPQSRSWPKTWHTGSVNSAANPNSKSGCSRNYPRPNPLQSPKP